MLRKDIAELVAKSSYIKSVKLKNGCWEFVYSDYNAGKLKKFKLPIRTTQPMLVRKLSSIKKQIGYKDRGLSSSERAYFVITSQFNDDGTFTNSYKKEGSLIVLDGTKRFEFDKETGDRVKTDE